MVDFPTSTVAQLNGLIWLLGENEDDLTDLELVEETYKRLRKLRKVILEEYHRGRYPSVSNSCIRLGR